MSLPAGVTGVTVSSDKPLCLPDGTPYEGSIFFDGPDLVTIAGQDVVLGGSAEAVLEDGEYSIILAPNDITGMSPTGWAYKVRGQFSNAPGWVRYITLSKNDTSVSLAEVLVPDPDTGEFTVVAPASTFLAKAQNLADVPDKAAAREHLELGGAALLDVGTDEDTVAAGDDPRFGEVNGVTVSGTPAAGQVLTATGTTAAEWAAASGSSPEWVFDITDPAYGAVGDAVVVSDGAVTGGVATLTCATSAPFHSGLVGKSVLIQGAGADGVTAFATTFASFSSSSAMGLTDTPPTSITDAVVVFGTNNYDAVRAATQAAEDYLAAGHAYAQVFTPPGGYVIDGPLDTSKSGNGQVPLDVYATTGVKKIPHFKGAGSGAGVRHWEQLVPQIAGSCWISFGFYASTSAQTSDLNANGNPGIISGPNEGSSNGLAYGASGRFSNIMPVLEDMAFLVPHCRFGITWGAANFFGCANAHVRNVSVSSLGVVPSATDYTSPGVFATGLSIGILMPAPGNNDLSIVDNLSIQGGFTYGIFFSEHTLVTRIMVLYCWAALCLVGTYAGSNGAAHSMRVLSASVESCTHEVYIVGAGSGGVGPIVDIELSTESSTPNIDGNSVGALMAAVGLLRLTGLFTPAGVSTAHPTGIEVIDGQSPRAIRRVSADFTARPIDRTLLCDTTSAGITGTLPDADVNPVQYTLRNVGVNTLTVATTSSQPIHLGDGTSATSTTLANGEALTVEAAYDGTTWGWYAI
ncbi:hypothetical protein LXH13_06155 [Streptomyces spinosirectus]|uniref:hypothetical protein n=1 Tax=Streptomyces TaxID=1883 RepID=UPI001C9D7C9A|nr:MULTISPECIES: hypothetical protein [Streptomyces]MBY8342012.1 hypothetical protein [Streptomyces plumbidurans]UIR16641.1 hypothetical protein LXH13_06155 [Streptomyces spinosirectus]